jgi:hypothetical protein
MFRQNEGWAAGSGDIKAHSESQQSATMMTGYGSPSSPSGDLSVDSDDPPIANIVTGSRKKRRKNVSAIAPPQVEFMRKPRSREGFKPRKKWSYFIMWGR